MGETAGSRHGVVNLFNASGALEATWTGADTPQTNFGFGYSLVGIGVDNSTSLTDWAAGDIYVADSEQKLVDVFKPEAGGKEKYVTQITGTAPGTPFVRLDCIAVSSATGDVLVGEEEEDGESVIDVFKPGSLAGEYEFMRQITGPPPTGRFPGRVEHIAVDGGDGDIYVQLSASGEEIPIDEFSETGAFIGEITGARSLAASFGVPGPHGVVADSESHRVFVGVHHRKNEVEGPDSIATFGANVVVPDVTITEPVSNPTPTSVTLRGTVNPVEAGEATCAFEYGTSTAYGKEVECAGPGSKETPIPSGPGGWPCTRRWPGSRRIRPITTGCPRRAGKARTPATWAPRRRYLHDPRPGYRARVGFGCGVHLSDARSDAKPAWCRHELPLRIDTRPYAPEEAPHVYEQSLSPLWRSGRPRRRRRSNSTSKISLRHAYHYRVVTVGEIEVATGIFKAEEFEGPERTFTTQTASTASSLPDGRAWELVTPPDKQGAGLIAIGNEQGADIQAAENGDRITYGATSPITANPEGSRSLEVTQAISTRTAPGSWETQDIATAHNEGPTGVAVGKAAEYKLFSADLSAGLVEPAGDTPLPPLPRARKRRSTFARPMAPTKLS